MDPAAAQSARADQQPALVAAVTGPSPTGPPGNPALEQALLGELLHHGSVDAARAHLGDTGSSFYDPFLGQVWTAVLRLHDAGRPVDANTVGVELNGHLRGGQQALFLDLIGAGGIAADAPGHAAEIARLHRQRQLLEQLERGAEQVRTDPGRIADVIAGLTALLPVRVDGDRTDWTGEQLMLATFEPIQWAVPGLVPSGLSLLVGAPKLGKSWLALDLALAVATAGVVLGRGAQGLPVEAGDVLYLALEDGPRRIQSRLRALIGDARPPHLGRLHVRFAWPSDAAGAVAAEAWLDDHPQARLIVVDTLGRIRGDAPRTGSAYQHDTAAVGPWQQLAISRNIAIVFVHHVRKAKSDDFVNEVSGTNGLAGVADVTIALDRARMDSEALLKVTGRDVEEREFALRRSETGWELTGALPQDPNLGDLSNQILSVLSRHNAPMSPGLIGSLVAQEPKKVSVYLGRLEASGRTIRSARGQWSLTIPVGTDGSVARSHSPIPSVPTHTTGGEIARARDPQSDWQFGPEPIPEEDR